MISLEIKPHKFPPVNFEQKFNTTNDAIFFPVLNIHSSRKAINSIHLLPKWAEAINEKLVNKLMIDSIHGTLAIEGNLSTEEDIKDTLSETGSKTPAVK